jgi:phage-related holin
MAGKPSIHTFTGSRQFDERIQRSLLFFIAFKMCSHFFNILAEATMMFTALVTFYIS